MHLITNCMKLYQRTIAGGLVLAGLAGLLGCDNLGCDNKSQNQTRDAKPQLPYHQVAEISGESFRAGIGITTADMDGDGDLDILIAGPSEGIKYLENQGNNRYANPIKVAEISGESFKAGIGITTADMDGDGDLDILIAGPSEGIKYLENQGQFR